MLTLLNETKSNKHRMMMGMFLCSCGNKKEIIMSSVKSGKTKSCGCLRARETGERRKKHNLSKTKLYNVWSHMKSRCYNVNNKAYKDYGERGISTCNEWKDDFIVFYNWAIKNGYKESLTIDRENNDGNYEPDNCRWITRAEQNKNRRKVYVRS